MNIFLDTKLEADELNDRVTRDCLRSGFWDVGTTRYCDPKLDPDTDKWIVPVIEGYEQFFTEFELTVATIAMDSTYRQVLKDRAFGQLIMNQFLAENKNMDMTLTQDLELLNAFNPIKQMLEVGAINRAYELWQMVTPGELVSQERWNKYNTLLSNYVQP
jgi:hypothetical protein